MIYPKISCKKLARKLIGIGCKDLAKQVLALQNDVNFNKWNQRPLAKKLIAAGHEDLAKEVLSLTNTEFQNALGTIDTSISDVTSKLETSLKKDLTDTFSTKDFKFFSTVDFYKQAKKTKHDPKGSSFFIVVDVTPKSDLSPENTDTTAIQKHLQDLTKTDWKKIDITSQNMITFTTMIKSNQP